jgi:signal transduction histidine kinase
MTADIGPGTSILGFLGSLRLKELWHESEATAERVVRFRRKAISLLLVEQWVLLVPISVTAFAVGNSWVGVLAIGAVFHAATTYAYTNDPTGLTTRNMIANGLLLDVLLLIYALSGTGSWQMDGGHMWVFAVWSHALGLLCWRSLLVSGTVGVLHHFVMLFFFPLWVFPDGANLWRVVLHGGVVVMQISVLCFFVFLIKNMLSDAERLEDALKASAARETEANQSKSLFLAQMSHELRTPLNAIIGFSDAMQRQMFGELSPRYVDYSAKIHMSGAHLHDLINDILDLSRVSSGKYEILAERVAPAEIVETCLEMVNGRARDRQIKMLVSAPDDLPALHADSRAMKQVLLNLLSNAIKYTPPGGSVMTSVARDEDGLLLTVTDTGIGISESEIKGVFEPFRRGDAMVARKTEGTGLGLAISLRLMQLHGGTLSLASKVGVGTSASARFPSSRIIVPPGPQAEAAGDASLLMATR